MYKIVFMGTPDFSVSILEAIYNAGHDVALAVSQPDKPAGRDLKIKPTPVKQFCQEHNIPILQPDKIRNNTEFINELKKINPDFIVTAAYGKILPIEILDIPKIAPLNVHASLLPKYRGAAPIQWSIINGETVTGVTIMVMDEGMDTGDMLLKEEIQIEPKETYGTLYDKLRILGGQVIVKALSDYDNLERKEQGDDCSLAPLIEKSLGKIDWNKDAISIHNLVRGLNPMPGAYFSINDKTYKVWETEVIDKNSNLKPGEIVLQNPKEGLIIQTGNGQLSIKTIQAQNSKRMNIGDYLRGNVI